MKTSLILLDGARGSGKSTISNLLKGKLKDTVFVGLDLIRNLITKSEANNDYNKIAYDGIVALTKSFIGNNISVVIDSGLTQERVEELTQLSKKLNIQILKYSLMAPKEVLWERIQERGKQRDKMPNRERFDYTHGIQQDKDFSDFIEIDTTKLNPEEITQNILDKIG